MCVCVGGGGACEATSISLGCHSHQPEAPVTCGCVLHQCKIKFPNFFQRWDSTSALIKCALQVTWLPFMLNALMIYTGQVHRGSRSRRAMGIPRNDVMMISTDGDAITAFLAWSPAPMSIIVYALGYVQGFLH